MSIKTSNSTLLLFGLVALIAFSSCKKNEANVAACAEELGTQSVWTAYLGDSDTIPAFPDRYANYWAYGFSRASMPQLGIRLTGKMPNARYASVNVYDISTQNSEGALLDELIISCTNDASKYVINVVASGTNTEGLDNVLQYDAAIDSVAIMLRYYLPEGDAQGGTDLPLKYGFDTETGKEMSLPVNIPLSANLDLSQLQSAVAPFFLVEEDTAMWFYNINPDGLYANFDNNYLATPITPAADEVYMVRFKAPNVQTDVRYWSLTQSNNSTFSFGTLSDADAYVAADGYVNVVIASPDAEIITKAAGLNLFEKEIQPNAGLVLIYRNLYTEPGFEGDISLVPRISINNISNLPELRSQNFINDYGPIGKRMSRQDFLDDFGGFLVSY
jgi:uncharacterized membrane protein